MESAEAGSSRNKLPAIEEAPDVVATSDQEDYDYEPMDEDEVLLPEAQGAQRRSRSDEDGEELESSLVPYLASQLHSSTPSSSPHIPRTLADVAAFQAMQFGFGNERSPSPAPTVPLPSQSTSSQTNHRLSPGLLPRQLSPELIPQHLSPEVVIPVLQAPAISPSQGSSSSELSDLPTELPVPLTRQASPPFHTRDSPPSPRTAAALEAAQLEQIARHQRSLRTRNPSQLNPYQIEAQRYAAALLRNDWEDALVGQRSVRVQEKRRVADEDREAEVLKAAATGADDETQDWLIDDMPSSDESVYTEVSDGNGGKQRQRSDKTAEERANKENLSPEQRLARKERAEAKRRHREERQARARALAEAASARVHHPGVKRARPIAPPLRPWSPPRAQAPREDLSYLVPQSEDEMDLISPPSNVFSPEPRRQLPAFMRQGSGPALGEDTDSDSSSGPVSTGVKRKARRRSNDDHTSGAADVDAPQRQAPEDSDSDAEYRRLFKHLRRMMPFHMARKHIEDVKNMRKGKAYHSDGHVSSTPEPSSEDERSLLSPDRGHKRSTPATSPLPESESLRPGEARKRTGPRAEDEAGSSRYALVGDSQSTSSDIESVASIISISSDDDEPNRRQESDTDASERDDTGWIRPSTVQARSRAVRRPKDSIDMLLSRAGGRKKNKRAKRNRDYSGPRTGQAQLQQTKLDGVTVRRMPAGFGQKTNGRNDMERRSGNRPVHKRMRQSRLQVEREERPAVDLLDDDTLFEFDMPAHRDSEFAFLDPPVDSAAADHDVRTGLDQGGGKESPIAGTRAAQLSSPHGYFMQPIGPLTPSTTASTFLFSTNADRQQPRPQAIHVVPPLPAMGRLSEISSSATSEPRRPTDLTTPSRPIRSEQTGSAARMGTAGVPHMDAETWGAYRRLRVDFGIKPLPFGLRFGESSYLGRGRLAQVLQAAEPRPQHGDTAGEDVIRSVFAMGIELKPNASVPEIIELLPSLFDAMTVAMLPDLSDTATSSLGLRSSVEDALRFLGQYLSGRAQDVDADQYATLWQALKSHLSRTCDRVQVMAKLGSDAHATAALSLRWFAVEYAWRALLGKQPSTDVPFAQVDYANELSFAAQQLMFHLLRHGLHHTFKAVREAANSKDDNARLSDLTAELWVCLIHLLRHQGASFPDVERICSFWSIFDGANKLLVDRGVGRQRLGASERSWYSIFAVCALSQFGHASGMTGTTPALSTNWSLVTFALSLVRFRFDEKTEKTMSSTSIQRRDAYIRVVLQRCLTLSIRWNWQLDNAELALSKLFDIFNSHKLCNLPSEIERTHDYPAFLCKYDESYLKEITPEDVGEGHGHGRPLVFHLFVKLLSRAAYDIRAAAVSPADAERRVSRLFSRMSPVRTMPFTNTSPPTSIERSILFNHYTMVLLYLLFVPSAANQRLRQIKSFLPFAGADIASQMTCVRAMLYVGVLFRHHDLPLQPVTAWFSEALPMLVQQHEALERQRLSGSKTGPYKDWTATALYRELRSTSTLLIAALRAIQHVLKHSSLDQTEAARTLGFPDLQLLQADWVKTVLEGQVAVDPAIGREAMNTIQEFLKQRNQVIAASQAPKERLAATTITDSAAGNVQEESQDSFAGMFDDVDMLMDDPVLASMLGEVADASEASLAQTTLNAKDKEFATLIKSTISPALFRLLSNVYHPDRAKAGERISLSFDDRLLLTNLHKSFRDQRLLLEQQRNRQRYVELVVDCWAGCADVLVRNGLRDWDKYFSSFGDESWKRISDPIGRRDVGLRFLHTALLRDPAAYEMYEGEFVSMWFQSSVSRLLSIQDRYTRTLIEIDGDGPFFRNMPWPRDVDTGGIAKLKDTDFLKLRLPALGAAFENLNSEFSRPSTLASSKINRKPMIFACISATVAAMRQNVEDTPISHPDRRAYLRFCLRVVLAMKEKLGSGILRGAGAEINSFEAHLISLGASLPPQPVSNNARNFEAVVDMNPGAAQPVEVHQQNTEKQVGIQPESINVDT